MNAYDCQAFDAQLLDYLYEELSDGERERLEGHVAGCARCTAEIAAFRRVRQAARSLPAVEPSPQVTARLLEAAAGRNVVPLPVRVVARVVAASQGADDESGRHAEAVAPKMAHALPKAVAAGASGSAPASASRAAPARSSLARRWLWHPGVAAAASFAAVGMGTMWFLATNRGAVTSPAALAPAAPVGRPYAPVAAEDRDELAHDPPAAAAPQGGEGAPAEETKSPRATVGGPLGKAEHEARLGAGMTKVPAVASGVYGRGDAAGGGGAGGASASGADGYEGGAVAHGRLSGQPIGQPSPAPARAPGGKGVSLHADENQTLERSVVAMREAAKKRDSGAGDKRASADDVTLADEALAGAPPADRRWAAPPPPPSAPAPSVSPASPPASVSGQVARRGEPRPDADEMAVANAEPALGNNQRARSASRQSPVAAFQDAKRRRCDEFLEAYRDLKVVEPAYAFTVKERMQVADCYGKTGQIDQARAEYDALRAGHPEMSQRIEAAQAQLSLNSDREQVAQRKAAGPSPAAPAAKAKAAPAKANKAAVDAAQSY